MPRKKIPHGKNFKEDKFLSNLWKFKILNKSNELKYEMIPKGRYLVEYNKINVDIKLTEENFKFSKEMTSSVTRFSLSAHFENKGKNPKLNLNIFDANT